jgi:hypothetical protein
MALKLQDAGGEVVRSLAGMIQLGPAPRPGCVLRPAASSASPVRLVQRRPARSEDVAVMGIGDKPEQLVARELGADSFSTYHATTSKPLCGEDLEPVAGAGRVLFVGGSPQVGSDIAHGPRQFILDANFLNRPSASAARERIVKPHRASRRGMLELCRVLLTRLNLGAQVALL